MLLDRYTTLCQLRYSRSIGEVSLSALDFSWLLGEDTAFTLKVLQILGKKPDCSLSRYAPSIQIQPRSLDNVRNHVLP